MNSNKIQEKYLDLRERKKKRYFFWFEIKFFNNKLKQNENNKRENKMLLICVAFVLMRMGVQSFNLTKKLNGKFL